MKRNRTEYSGAKLRAIIDAQGRRYEWIAERLDVSPSFLSRLMSGKKRINSTHALKAANALEIPVHWLEEDHRVDEAPSDEEVVRNV